MHAGSVCCRPYSLTRVKHSNLSSNGLQLQLLWDRSQQQEAREEIQYAGARDLSKDFASIPGKARHFHRAQAEETF